MTSGQTEANKRWQEKAQRYHYRKLLKLLDTLSMSKSKYWVVTFKSEWPRALLIRAISAPFFNRLVAYPLLSAWGFMLGRL